MEKAVQLQNQIRENTTELSDFLQDLTRWEGKIKDEDKNLKTERALESKLPPVRSRVKKPKEEKPATKPKKQEQEKEKPKQRISSYDYDAWSKFNVDEACKSSDDENEEDDESEEEDDQDPDELEQIQHQRSLQKAILEKEKGNQLFKEGKFEAAINRYTSAIGCDPKNPILYANRAMALIKTDKFAAAEQDCNVSLQLDPKYSKAIARRGTSRKKLKKYKEALDDFNHLIGIEPNNKQAVQEIIEIKKLLASNKTVVSTKKQEITEPIKPESLAKHKPRSNKPLKRVHITEIGGEETPSKTESKDVKQKKVPILNPKETFIVPTSSFMFETEFRNLKNNTENFYKYFKLIPLENYAKLFYQCIDNLISPFINILKECYIRDDVPVHSELSMFATVKRFDMAKMFLSSKDKSSLQFVLNHISSDSYRHSVDKEFITELKKKYL